MDRDVEGIVQKAGNSCPPLCGVCCFRHEVESTPLECYPVAHQLFHEGRADEIYKQIHIASETRSRICVLYAPDPMNPDHGRCSAYENRPLICRLFGYAASHNKYGQVRYMPCRIASQAAPDITGRVTTAILSVKEPPIFSDFFHRVADLKPDQGYRRMPINLALKEAIEQLSWKYESTAHREDAG